MNAQQASGAQKDDLIVTCAITADELAQRVRQIASEVSADYDREEVVVVGVLKGAWVFMADLVRQLTIPIYCDFVRISSYGSAMISSQNPELLLDVTETLAGKHVLLVDDIIDSGISIAWLRDHLVRKKPASLRFCVLLDKPARREVDIRPDYVGFEIPDQFVVGYGIDYAERYRELPYVGYVNEQLRDDKSR